MLQSRSAYLPAFANKLPYLTTWAPKTAESATPVHRLPMGRHRAAGSIEQVPDMAVSHHANACAGKGGCTPAASLDERSGDCAIVDASETA